MSLRIFFFLNNEHVYFILAKCVYVLMFYYLAYKISKITKYS